MLDFAAISVYVLYWSCMDDNIPRRDFMLQRVQELCAEWMASKVAQCLDMTLTNAEEQRRMTCRVKAHWKKERLPCAACGRCTKCFSNTLIITAHVEVTIYLSCKLWVTWLLHFCFANVTIPLSSSPHGQYESVVGQDSEPKVAQSGFVCSPANNSDKASSRRLMRVWMRYTHPKNNSRLLLNE